MKLGIKMKYIYILLLIVIIIIVIILYNKTKTAYYLSKITSIITCKKIDKDYKLCKNIYINNNDISAPANTYRIGFEWEKWMNNILIENSCDKLALDIGAHIGVHTVKMSNYFKEVFAFEPNTNIINNLKLNTQNIPNVKIFNKAIGNDEKYVNLDITDISCQSKIKKENFLTVKQIKLDNIIKEPVGFIKIDIEEYEIEAFKGMYNILEMYKPVIVYEDWSNDGEHSKYLKNTHNYTITRINKSNFIAK